MRKHKGIIITLFCLLTVSCTSQNMAPVVDAWAQPTGKANAYRVKPGDTLYSVAWSLNLDYRSLARINHLKPPYAIHPGETIKTRVMKTIISPPHRKTYFWSRPRPQKTVWPPPQWKWPARGRIIQAFSKKPLGNKGLDIVGKLGEPIYAAANGEVVYSGAGVRGYGNLIIIKHNASFLSAYAFNKKLLVNIGQRIHRGQKIALMGRDNAGKVMLHFEIRKNGKPVDPRIYL